MPQSPGALNAALIDLARRYAAEARDALGCLLISIALFGSVARGQAAPCSEIDLFVVLKEAPASMLSWRRMLAPARESLMPELEARH